MSTIFALALLFPEAHKKTIRKIGYLKTRSIYRYNAFEVYESIKNVSVFSRKKTMISSRIAS